MTDAEAKKLLKSRWWRLNNLYSIIDERGQKIKFQPQTRTVQTELFDNLWFCNEILKSRQHGITTFFCIYFLDACLWYPNTRAGIIAHNREDAEAFFSDKVKFAYDEMEHGNKLCAAMKEMNESPKHSSRELLFTNNSAIRVGTSLRSATLQYLLISEYGKICAKFPEKAKEIRTGALNTIHKGQFIAIESTAEGREGHFFELDRAARAHAASGKELTEMDYKHFFFAWWQKPEYMLETPVPIPIEHAEYFKELKVKHGIELTMPQKFWYVKKYETQQDEMKREFPSTADEAFEAAIIGAYYSKQLMKARETGRIGEYPYDPSYLVQTGWDLGINDEMSIWFFQEIGQWIQFIRYYENTDEALDHYLSVMEDTNYHFGKHYAPHDIKKRDLISGRTRLARAKDLGINFVKIDRAADVIEDINEVRRLFFRFRFDAVGCDQGIKSLEGYRKEWNDKQGCFRGKPLHNWASNGADAIRTVAHGVLNVAAAPSGRNLEPGTGPRMVADHPWG